MTIHNPDSYVRNLWDWSILNGCLGDVEIEELDVEEHLRLVWDWAILDGCFGETKIKPMDIDGATERNNQCLLIETKEPGVAVKPAQHRFFVAMSRKPGVTVFYVWGHPGAPTEIQVMTEGRLSRRFPCDLDTLRAWVSHWYSKADRGAYIHIDDEDLDGAA